MYTPKVNSLCILHILKEYSDENHIMPMREIISKMDLIYGISVDRRTVYSSVAALIGLGIDISDFEENGKGYFLRSREFEISEIRMLMDSVYSAAFIPQKQTFDLIEKLQSLLSIHQRNKYKNLKIFKPLKKTSNREVFYNIELLDEAISKGIKVKFDYVEYDFNKKLVPRREFKYLVNPYGLVCANEKYYLICNYDYFDKISHYRIDFMKNIELTEDKIKKPPTGFDIHEYSNKAIYMYGGENETVEMICQNSILDDVIDKFGTDVRIKKNDDNNFTVNITASPYGIKFWALQFLSYCEIITPKWLREEIAESIKIGIGKYKT